MIFSTRKILLIEFLFLILLIMLSSCSSRSNNNDNNIIIPDIPAGEAPNYTELPAKDKGCFYTDGSVIRDANGNPFIIRGVNNPHIWWDTQSYDALGAIAATGANTIRIVWETKGDPKRLQEIIQKCIDLKMIAMPELHDATGSNDREKLKNMARYWARDDVKAVINNHQKYVLVNIANEWSSSYISDGAWREVYKEAIAIMREAGIETMIVVDSAAYAQRASAVKDYGQHLLNCDPLHNLLFSIHMYVEWNDKNKISTELKNIKDLNLPLVIGEFGYNYQNGSNNLSCRVDAQTVMDECQEQRFGYIPWSWTGNNAENAWLDITSFSDWSTLTSWGELVINGDNGIKKTASICSVFQL